jgi:hypothetical protein
MSAIRATIVVRKVAPDGTVSTFAGGGTADPRLGGAAIDARILGPSGLTFDAAGGLLIAAQGTSQIFRVSPDGNVSHVAGDGLVRFAGDGGPATLASFNLPRDVAVDPSGNIYISDSANARVRVLPVALPTIGATPASLSFTVRAGDPSPAPQQVRSRWLGGRSPVYDPHQRCVHFGNRVRRLHSFHSQHHCDSRNARSRKLRRLGDHHRLGSPELHPSIFRCP